jgi:DNA-binding MarR family transcriptional regulator
MKQNPLFKIHQFTFLAEKELDRRLQEDVGLSFSQCMILNFVYHNPEISQRAVAYDRCITPAAVSRHIEALESLGLIRRRDREENRREHVLVITREGERIVVSAERLVDQTLGSFLSDVDERDLDSVDVIFSQLLRRLRG